MDRAAIVHENFLRRLSCGDLPVGGLPDPEISKTKLNEIFRSQVLSRQLDRTSRKMQASGKGFYTIGSSGHEGMAAVAESLRPTDMAFLHYRDAAFQIQRANQVAGQTPVWDMLLSFRAAASDPISGGRHKVLGSKALNIPPQTSTIASHLPKAVGAAYSLGLARRKTPEHQLLPEDSIVMCSFGDASSNHSTAQGAINTACWTSFQSVPLPLLFVCEDNGIGISVPTPRGWVAANFANRPGLKYFSCNGLDMAQTLQVSQAAADYVRRTRKPAFLHITTVRLYGHAGSDVEMTYRDKAAIEAGEANDPLLHSARILRDSDASTLVQCIDIYNETEATCNRVAEEVMAQGTLVTAQEVMASIVPPLRECTPSNGPAPDARMALFGNDIKQMSDPQPMSRLIGWALADLMLEHEEIIVAGEDVGRKGGVYGVTQKLQNRFGPDRVIDTLLDEQSILGLAIGMGHNGFVPIPEIQFLAYLHNAEDQLRGEAATLSFFSDGQYTNPMVLRIAGLGYQKGFGGHFHNDNSLAVLRDIPGVIIACPSNGADAAMMLREAVRLAREEQRVVVFIEPIALYPMRDLHDTGDGQWLTSYPAPDRRIAVGEIGVDGEGQDLAIISYANGYYLSTQAKAAIEESGIKTRVIDMRWLAPLPAEALIEATKGCKNILIVDECRRTGSQSEGLMALFMEAGHTRVSRVTAQDSFIPTGPAYAATLPSTEEIIAAAKTLVSS
ncbi:dehydrogenase E1 component subunit alpha/beta [Sulfitobacter donghicola]|uniref:2-oxoglutarate dehydrogenase E1 component n=1 Tax=Sulfitobacter donghicola DSW-25 = KCTC 12864 = JCM 14565 TaxID=1300350 RepID=A0A073IT47_9RHOB|nr:alpha-ketoacid dehydrogenase subunit alpha/beta [Sulfitobacter donghicola]KEJ88542.1 MFS transporter [Sulfitobacter donghicola DSW-25 = KCTC 12864 = JCM 14565]KIN69574.1 Transketolase/dehydrogenase E1 family protein [Sulfitobacter donghicola DSW-25 = KCTC 12864 = JCM 14565]